MPIDYSKYPPNWKTEIRPRILERANNCCEDCGVPNYAIILRDKNSRAWRHICGSEHDMIKSKIRVGYNMSGAIKKLGFTKIILTIAHLKHDKENHDVKDEDLKALCQKCHLRHDLKRHIENRKYGIETRRRNYKLDL